MNIVVVNNSGRSVGTVTRGKARHEVVCQAVRESIVSGCQTLGMVGVGIYLARGTTWYLALSEVSRNVCEIRRAF